MGKGKREEKQKPTLLKITKKKRKSKFHRRPKAEWRLYIARVAADEGYRLHGDALEVINNQINYLLSQLGNTSKELLRHSKRETYTRNTLRRAALTLLSDQHKLAQFALDREKQLYLEGKQK